MNEDLMLHRLIGAGGGGSNIKSIQHGVTSGFDIINVTIAPVDTNKSIAFCYIVGGVNQPVRNEMHTARLINGTTLRIQKDIDIVNRTLRWAVIEYKEIKSLQVVEQSSSTAITNIPISTVDLSKSFVVHNFRSSSTEVGATGNLLGIAYFPDNSTVRIEYAAAIQRTFVVQVVEFN